MMLGKLVRDHPTLSGHFAPAYLGGSNKLRAYLFFICGRAIEELLLIKNQHCRIGVDTVILKSILIISLTQPLVFLISTKFPAKNQNKLGGI